MTNVLSGHAQKYNDMIDQDGITLKQFSTWFELRWKDLQPWKPWTKYFESYIFLQPLMTIDHLVIFVTFNTPELCTAGASPVCWARILTWFCCAKTSRHLDLTRSILWLLISWLLASPGHQQKWYWLHELLKINVGPCLTRGRISTTFVVSVWRNDRNCEYLFMFLLKNLARSN